MEPTNSPAEKTQQPVFTFIDTLPFGCLMLDTEGKISFANKPFLNLFSLQTTPQTLAELDTQVAKAGLGALYAQAVQSKSVAETDAVCINDKILRIYTMPVLQGEKNIGGMIILEDITTDKESEKRKDEFLAVASHELRMPLVAIKDNAELMIQHYYNQLPNKDMQEMITDIDKASIRLIGVVNNFLDLAKVENGKINFVQEDFILPDLVNSVFVNLRSLAEKRQLTLTSSFPAGLPKAHADKGHTEQVLINLIGNAIKYTEHGGVTVSAYQKDGKVCVEVSDTGSGISEKFTENLFKKFKQADGIELAQQISQGSGLGLYISKLLVEGMGGTIWLEKSIIGQGSVFAFTLPAAVV